MAMLWLVVLEEDACIKNVDSTAILDREIKWKRSRSRVWRLKEVDIKVYVDAWTMSCQLSTCLPLLLLTIVSSQRTWQVKLCWTKSGECFGFMLLFWVQCVLTLTLLLALGSDDMRSVSDDVWRYRSSTVVPDDRSRYEHVSYTPFDVVLPGEGASLNNSYLRK